jgi:hypothetical protein
VLPSNQFHPSARVRQLTEISRGPSLCFAGEVLEVEGADGADLLDALVIFAAGAGATPAWLTEGDCCANVTPEKRRIAPKHSLIRNFISCPQFDFRVVF